MKCVHSIFYYAAKVTIGNTVVVVELEQMNHMQGTISNDVIYVHVRTISLFSC